jgi:hypothetical protein
MDKRHNAFAFAFAHANSIAESNTDSNSNTDSKSYSDNDQRCHFSNQPDTARRPNKTIYRKRNRHNQYQHQLAGCEHHGWNFDRRIHLINRSLYGPCMPGRE